MEEGMRSRKKMRVMRRCRRSLWRKSQRGRRGVAGEEELGEAGIQRKPNLGASPATAPGRSTEGVPSHCTMCTGLTIAWSCMAADRWDRAMRGLGSDTGLTEEEVAGGRRRRRSKKGSGCRL